MSEITAARDFRMAEARTQRALSKTAAMASATPKADSSQADAEKMSRSKDAKARVLAGKRRDCGARQRPKLRRKKEEGRSRLDASKSPLVQKLKGKLNGGVLEAVEFLGQLSVRIDARRSVALVNS